MKQGHEMRQKLVTSIAHTVDALQRCEASGNPLAAKHRAYLAHIEREHLPSGSGFDSGTTIDVDASRTNRLVLLTSFHHRSEYGYCGWSDHQVIVTPSLVSGFDVRVAGRNFNDIKDYIAETFRCVLDAEGEQVLGEPVDLDGFTIWRPFAG